MCLGKQLGFFYKFSEQETSISSACLPRHNFQIRNANKQLNTNVDENGFGVMLRFIIYDIRYK